jgi:hypothetical protein
MRATGRGAWRKKWANLRVLNKSTQNGAELGARSSIGADLVGFVMSSTSIVQTVVRGFRIRYSMNLSGDSFLQNTNFQNGIDREWWLASRRLLSNLGTALGLLPNLK